MYSLRRTLVHATAVGSLLFGLSSCVSYHRAYQLAAPVQTDPGGRYTLAYVEADDLGWFHDKKQADSVLRMVRERASNRNVAVVVYVHGWHHSARCCDSNAECFKSSLAVLDQVVDAPAYRAARKDQKIAQDVDVIGIYVGWRGRTFPSIANYTTFWSRKATAERVGGGDLRNFLHQLGVMYDEFNRPDGAGADSTLMGLVTIGHSFGAQAVFRATSQRLERELVDAGGLAADPARSGERALIAGLGDLTVLVNPAVEAAAFEPMHKMARGLRFDTLQTPSLVVFSATNDFPRNFLFPAGRAMGNFLGARSSREQRAMDRRALGVYPSQQTHTLTWDPPAATSASAGYVPPTVEREAAPREQGACRSCQYEGTAAEIPDMSSDTWKPSDFARAGSIDFNSDQTIAGSHLAPIGTVSPHSPFLVVRTSSAIIDGHNGIFSHRFSNFLIRYVADIQAKRLLTRRGRSDALGRAAAARSAQ